LNETIIQQAELAKHFGISGFCFYHYWFNGKLVLNRPLEDMLSKGTPNFPFMYCWANENWTRRWDGSDETVLLNQDYSFDDDLEHIKYLLPIFTDNRYIKVDGKPVFIIYKPWLFPNISKTIDIWRNYASKNGIELYLCHMVFGYLDGWGALIDGFDAAVDFEPFGIRRSRRKMFCDQSSMRAEMNNKSGYLFRFMSNFKIKRSDISTLNIKSYISMSDNLTSLADFKFKLYPSICPGWDNSPRRGKDATLILHDNDPKYFEKWYGKIINEFKPFSKDENFIFINAWNEWAEGNHLEPCTKYGLDFLQAIKRNSNS
jgi:hypothetical protein